MLAEKRFERLGYREAKHNRDTWHEIGKHHRVALARQVGREIECLKGRGWSVQQEQRLLGAAGGPANPEALRADAGVGVFLVATGALLLAASYYFLVVTLEPFRLNHTRLQIISGAVAVLTAVLTHLFFRSHHERKMVVFSACATGLVMLFTALTLLAIIRANLFGLMVGASSGSSHGSLAPASGLEASVQAFYSGAVRLLRFVLPLLAFVLDLGAGIALHEGLERILSPALLRSIKERKLHRRLAVVHARIEYLQSLPEIFDAKYTAGGLKGESHTQDRDRQLAAWIPIVLGILFLLIVLASRSFASTGDEAKLDSLIILLDLSNSTNAKVANDVEEFSENRSAVERLLAKYGEPGTAVTVIGITGQSWAKPLLLLQSRVDNDPGYFGEKLEGSRRRLVSDWRRISEKLHPSYPHTDILGALMLAGQVLGAQHPRHPVLAVLSDMRQSTEEMDVEKSNRFDVASTIEHVRRVGMIAPLKGVSVHVLGCEGVGRPVSYWNNLKEFWEGYFKETGASVVQYTNLR
jgi:hypothetical protein